MCEVRAQVVACVGVVVGVVVVGQLLVEVHVQVEGDVVVSFLFKASDLRRGPCVGSVSVKLTRVRGLRKGLPRVRGLLTA